MNINEIKHKTINLFKSRPKEIFVLIIFSLIVGVAKFVEGCLNLMVVGVITAAAQQADAFSGSLMALLEILVGILYIYVAKWIWNGEERGRSSLFFVTLIDLIFSMWTVSAILSNLIKGVGVSINSLWSLLFFIIFSYIVYITTKDKIKSYFR